MTPAISRRRFLAVGVAAAGVALGVVAVRTLDRDAGREPVEDDALRRRLTEFLSDPDGAAALGATALASQPADPSELAERISSPASPGHWFEVAGVDDFRDHVRERVRADFAAGDAVDIEGWRLSRTEADLCALWSHLSS